jgi:hypothetical protein
VPLPEQVAWLAANATTAPLHEIDFRLPGNTIYLFLSLSMLITFYLIDRPSNQMQTIELLFGEIDRAQSPGKNEIA